MTRGDFLVALLSLGALPMVYRAQWGRGGEAAFALVRTADATPSRLPLDQSGRHVVPGPLGETIIEIEQGRARIAASPCTNQSCVRAGWIEHTGAATACIPNRISLRIDGHGPGFDTLHY